MQVKKWGDQLVVCVPESIVDALKLSEGDEVEVEIARARGTEARSAVEVARALAQLRSLRGLLPADYVFDREEANSRDQGFS